MPQQKQLNAVCDDDTFQLTLNGSGIIQLHPSCVVKNDIITIQGHQELRTKLHISYVSTGIPTSSLASVHSLNNLPEAHVFHTKIKELDAIQRQVNSLKASSLPQGLTYQHHGTIVAYILGIMVIALLIKCSWRYYHRNQHRASNEITSTQTPTAAPRLQAFNTTEC